MTRQTEPEFIHRYIPATQEGRNPLLLLHGTGGNEEDLLPVAQQIAPGRAVLSPRGKVLENGMPRFFRRLAEGVFDEPDVVRRAGELADFIDAFTRKHGLGPPIAVGFSNGANIAAAMLLLRPQSLSGAVLLRAMTPLHATPPAGKLAATPVLMLSGAMDPIIPEADAAQLAAQLTQQGAHVTHQVLPASHGLTRMDLDLARDFLETAG
jgi:phospholipase/carboxylesterase